MPFKSGYGVGVEHTLRSRDVIFHRFPFVVKVIAVHIVVLAQDDAWEHVHVNVRVLASCNATHSQSSANLSSSNRTPNFVISCSRIIAGLIVAMVREKTRKGR